MNNGSPRSDFLSEFEPHVIPQLLGYADTLSRTKADVILLTARKAACLYDGMRSIGMIAPVATVVSDRVLDLDLEWLAGKTVLLVDDVLVTGSTLYRQRLRLLQEAHVASVELLVLAVDTDAWSPELATPDYPYLQLTDSQALNLCTQIVDALSVIPRPYNVDWPIIETSSMTTSSLFRLQGLPGWRMLDARSSLQVRRQVENVTHQASKAIRERVLWSTGIAELPISLVKVRIYGRKRSGATDALDLRVLPMVVLDEMRKADSDDLFDSLAHDGTASERAQYATATARARFIQFALAIRLGRIWMSDAREATGLTFETTLAENQLSLAFSPPAQKLLKRIETTSAQVPGIAPPRTIRLSTLRKSDNDVSLPIPQSLWEAQTTLTEPFLDLYVSKELPTRDVLLRRGTEAFSDPSLEHLLDRLNRGYTFRQLEALVAFYDHRGVDPGQLVSAFLDMAIDHGVVVPVTSDVDGLVRRAYRHGEDVKASLNELSLFGEVLWSACQAVGNEVLPRIFVEKLFVIYLRIGLQARHLNRWLGKLGKTGTIGVRWKLKGAVVQLDSASLFGSDPGNGLADFLLSVGVLKRRGQGYIVGNPKLAGTLREEQTALARKVGQLFGMLSVASDRDMRLTTSDLTLLASVPDARSTMSALAAEIHIISRAWGAMGYRTTAAAGNGAAREAQTHLAQSELFEAASSGAWKYRAFKSGAPRQTIDRVARSFADPLYREEWRSYWPPSLPGEDVATPAIVSMCEREGRWLLASEVYLLSVRAILCCSYGDQKQAGKLIARACASARDHVQATRRSTSAPERHVISLKEAMLDDSFDPDAALRDAVNRISVLIVEADALLDAARAGAQLYGEAATIVGYSHALRIHVNGPEDALTRFNAFAESAIRRGMQQASKSGAALADVELSEADPSRTVVSRGEPGLAILANLASEIEMCAPIGVSLRQVLLVDLPDSEMAYGGAPASGFYCESLSRVVENVESSGALVATEGDIHLIGRVDAGRANDTRLLVTASKLIAEKTGGNLSEEGPIDKRTVRRVSRGLDTQQRPTDQVDIGIVTVISPETRAVLDWMKTSESYRERLEVSGRFSYRSDLVVEKTEVAVACVQALAQGNQSVVMAVRELDELFAPKTIILLGIAGSISPDVTLGDVVFATQVIDYGPSAYTKTGLVHRGISDRLPARTLGALNHFLTSSFGARFDSGASLPPGASPTFAILSGPIGAGYAVIKYRRSKLRRWLQSFNEKTLAVETESVGFATYFYERQDSDLQHVYFVIRGISDHADLEKTDLYQSVASENAVSALRFLLGKSGPALTLRDQTKI